MYSQSIKIQLDKELIAVILKKLKYRNLDEYVNDKLKQESSKLMT